MEPRGERGSPSTGPPISEAEALRRELARTAAERDTLLHLVLRTNSTALGRLGRRWARYTSDHPWAGRWISRPARLLWLLLTLRWPAGLRVSPLFDEAWYREQYVDAPKGRRAAYRQYLRLSVEKGRDPNPHFDTDWYLEHNPDVRGGHWHPLDHYLYFGWREARDPSPDFDGFDYLRHHPDAVEQAMNPLLHSMRASPFEPTDPSAARLPGPPPAISRTITHFQRYGARRTASRVATELGLDGLARSSDLPRPDITEADPRRITAHLDTPRPGATEGSSVLLVSGWAFSERSALNAGVYLDGVLATEAVTGQPRPDVASFHRGSDAARDSGFSARLSLGSAEPGPHAVHVVLRDEEGAVRVLEGVFRRADVETMYHEFYRRSLPTPEELALVRTAVTAEGVPSVHLLVRGGEAESLERTRRSIAAQGYPGLTHTVISSAQAPSLPDHPDPARLVGFLHAGETLAPGALWRLARTSQGQGVRLVYSDHDHVEETGRHVDPWLVPDWSPDHALAQDLVGGFYLVRDSGDLREALAALEDIVDPAWRYRVLLATTREGNGVVHLEQVTWSSPEPEPESELLATAQEAAVRNELAARGAEASVGTVHDCAIGAIRHVEWSLAEAPLVSIIIPTTGRLEWVRQVTESLAQTEYPRTEVIFIDNSRGRHPEGIAYLRELDVTVLERDEPFNWAKLNNDGARSAHGSMLLFLNDDIEATEPIWLTAMVRQASRPDVGAVGALMLYPDGTIQHAGVYLVGHGGGAVHVFRGLDPDGEPYLDWHRVTREVTAVTGAAMLVPRAAFNQLGGFDEELAIAGNDVDLCLRVARGGKRVLMEPQAALIHHESRSRAGVDHYPDESRMWERWSSVLSAGDRHYNSNLSESRVDASLEWERVAGHRDPILRADPTSGVNLVGYIRAEMGLGEATRGEALALHAAEVPFVIIDHQGSTPARLQDASWVHAIADQPVFDTNILHINADQLPQALQQLPEGLTRGRRNIGVWTWELPEFPDEWRGSFSLVDEVWVPSTFVRDAIGADAPVPVHVVPHVVRRPKGPFLGREHFGLPEDTFQFLAMYDTQSVMERKNPQGAIEAFTRAFTPDDDTVSLVLKVNSAGDREVAALRRLTSEHSNIHLVTDTLSRHAVDSLMASSDTFVSLHRSEGFGLPIAEAMALGLPVVATGWSGNMDFMDEEVAGCVEYQLVELGRSVGPYRAGQRWAEPDLDDAAASMRRFRQDPAHAAGIAEVARRSIFAGNRPSVVGQVIAARLGFAAQPAGTR